MTPPMVSFAGPSGTGKTTLLEGVIADLKGRGYRVGAVKHDAHRIELDTEGKDSWRLRQAGADVTLLVGRDQLAWFGTDRPPPELAEVANLLAADADIILVEGYRSAGLPTVVVARPDHKDGRWEPPAADLVLMTAHPVDVDAVADLIEQRFLA
jgi:molybdopterin-guanine dinucleotide biosynthesis protein MobB